MHRITIKGVVQGVGFRPSVVRAAGKLGISGYVRNDGSHVTVEIDFHPERFMEMLREELGPMARIEDVKVEEIDKEAPSGFSIEPSTKGERDSSLPYDTAICEKCLDEMNDPFSRRFRHPFTNCTDCGARYTLIDELPYDRERTSMGVFTPCKDCGKEYSDISFRRYHAQTLSCKKDGPSYSYLDRDLKIKSTGWGAFLDCARAVHSGERVIVKGWGGMHIISNPGELEGLRKWYGRPYKPFAIMVDSIETACEIARIGEYEKEILGSPARPILLCSKNEDAPSWSRKGMELASPGLSNIGIYLPYSGIHHLLFSALKELKSDLKWVVMTSANPPGEPMALDIDDVQKMDADGYFIHDRRISARCDDSVIVPVDLDSKRSAGPFGIKGAVIRKGRGMVPDPIDIGHERTILAVGAERNVSITVTSSGRAFTTPYIGNTRHPDVLEYARSSADRFSYLFGAEDIEEVICDLHPRYATRKMAMEIAEEKGIAIYEVQHHHAHSASLQADAGLERLGCVVVDGIGYGSDGLPWGGEAIISSGKDWKRIGHLENFGLPGGDSSAYHPERIAHWLTKRSGLEFTTGNEQEDRVLSMSHEKAVMTSSLGRFLDALSSLMLGVTWRTYDGEPAIRLETLLMKSRSPMKETFQMESYKAEVPVAKRWKILLEEIDGPIHPGIGIENGADLAMGLVSSIIEDLVSIINGNDNTPKDGEGRSLIGLSGGVSYNVPIMRCFVDACKDMNAVPVLHSRVPPGDGGISVGQAYIAGK